jgi:undecaprenyl-diphosphatase
MTFFQALVLGTLQGLSEFLPISSSAHLALAPWLFGWPEPGLPFDVALHVGTLIAVLGYFRAEWVRLAHAAWNVVRTRSMATVEERRAVFLVVATIPGVIGGVLLQKQAEHVFRAPWLVAVALIAMGILLWLVDSAAQQVRTLGSMTMGRALSLDRGAAATFSFLMSMPIIAGAAVYEGRHLLHGAGLGWPVLVGIAASAVSGWLAIDVLLRFVTQRSYGVFALYRLVLGVVVLMLVFQRA